MPRPAPEPVRSGQESVWDYPRPPRVERTGVQVAIAFDGRVIVDTDDVVRVLETSHPPVYYLPIAAFVPGSLAPTHGSTVCEWKGQAVYYDVVGPTGARATGAAWGYPHPDTGHELLADRVAVYARAMKRCTVAGETVVPQPGGFYGGWITSRVVGPFKGGPGSSGW